MVEIAVRRYQLVQPLRGTAEPHLAPANILDISGLNLEYHYDLCTRNQASMESMSSSKDRKRRQKRRGSERHKELKLAYEESKKALEREQRVKKALER